MLFKMFLKPLRYRYVLTFFAALSVTLALVVKFEGIYLDIENQSGYAVSNVSVKYSVGSFYIPLIPAGESEKKSLGKIGEESKFLVWWTDKFGSTRGAKFEVYFDSFAPFTDVRIVLKDRGQVILYKEDYINKPVETW